MCCAGAGIETGRLLGDDVRRQDADSHDVGSESSLGGAPCIQGELVKLGIDIGETSVSEYMVRYQKPPSQTWRTFLASHIKDLVSVDFFTVPTIRFQVLDVFLVLAHDRRRIVHINVTAYPTAAWTAQQLRDAFPWNTGPRCLLRDRDRIFGTTFHADVEAMGIKEVLSAPHSPWQRAYVERGDRIHSPRVPGPRHRAQRGQPTSDDHVLSRLPSRVANSPLPGQECSCPTGCATAALRYDQPSPACPRFASPRRTSGRLTVASTPPTVARTRRGRATVHHIWLGRPDRWRPARSEL
jgi:hypothetical protein